MLSPSEYEDLIRQRDEAKQEADQTEGAYKEIMKELRKKYGCATVQEAKVLLKKLQRKKARLEAEEQRLVDKARSQLKKSKD